jgi:hypothetical protein
MTDGHLFATKKVEIQYYGLLKQTTTGSITGITL